MFKDGKLGRYVLSYVDDGPAFHVAHTGTRTVLFSSSIFFTIKQRLIGLIGFFFFASTFKRTVNCLTLTPRFMQRKKMNTKLTNVLKVPLNQQEPISWDQESRGLRSTTKPKRC